MICYTHLADAFSVELMSKALAHGWGPLPLVAEPSTLMASGNNHLLFVGGASGKVFGSYCAGVELHMIWWQVAGCALTHSQVLFVCEGHQCKAGAGLHRMF